MKTAWLDAGLLEDTWTPQFLRQRVAVNALHRKQETKPLGELCTVQSGQYADEYLEETDPAFAKCFPYVRVDNIRPYVANMNRVDLAFVRSDHPAVSARSVIKADDVVIARTGTLGKATLAVSGLMGTVASQHVTRLTVKQEQRDVGTSPEFLCAFLNSAHGREQLIAGGYGSTRPELTKERLTTVRVPVLPAEGRAELDLLVRRGCEALARSGDLIRKAVHQYERSFDRILDVRTEMRRAIWLTGEELQRTWAPRFHASWFEDALQVLPEHFEMRQLGDLARIQRGKGTRTRQYCPSGIPFVRTTSLINGGIDPFPDHYASEKTHEEFGQQIEPGDILLSIEGKIGQVAYLTGEDRCVFKNHIERIEMSNPAHVPLVFLFLSSYLGQEQMRRLTVVQATLPGLANRSREIWLPIEPLGSPSNVGEVRQGQAVAADLLRNALDLRARSLIDLRKAHSLAEAMFT